jgi:hypothetical protein
VWGSKRRVTGVTVVTSYINRLILLEFIGVTHHSTFVCIRCYKPKRCYSSVTNLGNP